MRTRYQKRQRRCHCSCPGWIHRNKKEPGVCHPNNFGYPRLIAAVFMGWAALKIPDDIKFICDQMAERSLEETV